MNIIKEGNTVLLCCGKGRCPVLKKSEDKKGLYELTDDFDNKVFLEKDNLIAIAEALKSLDDS